MSFTTNDNASNQALSGFAWLSSWNPYAANSLRTLNLRTLPGETVSNLSTTAVAEAFRKRSNIYVTERGVSVVKHGTTFAGYADQKIGQDWFENELVVFLFETLRTGIPYNADGLASLVSSGVSVCESAVSNGFLSPGFTDDVTRDTIRSITGLTGFTGALPLGYLVWIEPFSGIPSNSITQRNAPPLYIWGNQTGAIHTLEIRVQYSR